MWEKFLQIWKVKDLRKNILFVLGALVVFRMLAHIPVPGVNVENLRAFFSGNQLLGLMNIFAGGGMSNFSIVMLGVAPYITASIIFQLLAMIIPKLEEMSKEEGGRQKINMYTRLATVPLALLQAFGMINLLRQSSRPILENMSAWNLAGTMIVITAGTVFLMWLGELITEKKIGNGISLLIFAGIVARVPSALQEMMINFNKAQLINLLVFVAIAGITIAGVVIINEAQRNIPVVYAKRVRGARMYGGTSTHLPIRINQAGVIPIIFALSILLFPQMIVNLLAGAQSPMIQSFSRLALNFINNPWMYASLYFVLVFLFTYFYTAVTFDPESISHNLQKSGAFIPGIRPGPSTAEHLGKILKRITLIGAVFLGLIAVLPLAMRAITGNVALTLGGTALLILVSVALETTKQIQAQISMREYE